MKWCQLGAEEQEEARVLVEDEGEESDEDEVIGVIENVEDGVDEDGDEDEDVTGLFFKTKDGRCATAWRINKY